LVEQEGVVTGDDRYRILTRHTHEELATMIGAMKELIGRGAIGHAGKHIVVESTETLQRIAEDTA
jgi:hypothetical protein